MNGGELFVKCLENEDVNFIFTLPGEEILDVLHYLYESPIKPIIVRHEQAAAFMADVYGRLTGKAGVCLSTLGPGATNLITGVADANLDRAPLVAITGQGELERTHKESHQYIDIVNTFKFITKWNRTITRADFIPEMVRKAFKIAQTEKMGATHLELPEDIAQEETKSKPLKKTHKHSTVTPDLETIKDAASLIRESKYPIILAGNGVIRTNASEELVKFAKVNNIPITTTFMGKGTISYKEDLALGTIGLQSKDFTICGFEKANLIITIGYDHAEYSPRFWNPNADKKIIHIDSRHSEIDEHYVTTIDLIGNIKETLKLLIKHTGFKKDTTYFFKLKKLINNELEKNKSDDSLPMKPQKILSDVRAVLDEDDILISGVGMHKVWVARLYPAYKPNTVIISNGLASMGISLPGAIAAKLAYPERKVVAIAGDGEFMMNVQELETAKRLGLSFTVVIFNDKKYAQIEWKQMKKFKKTFGIEFTNPDFVKLAESFHVKGAKVEKANDFQEIFRGAVNSKDIWLIDVEVDSKENMKLSESLGGLICPT